MKRCEEVQNVLAVYLDGEITPAERALIQDHLSRCEGCREELASLADTRTVIKQALHTSASHANPPPHAWSQLQARLVQEQAIRQPYRAKFRRIPAIFTQPLSGANTMFKSAILTSLTIIVVVAIAINTLPQHATPSVSAQDILDRAYATRQTAQQIEGIHHTQTEIYYNNAAMGISPAAFEGLSESTSLIENYLDYETGTFRSVITDKDTGMLLNVSAYDGAYLYSSMAVEEAQPPDVFTIYRMPQAPEVMRQWGVAPGSPESIDAERAFEAMRNDPNTELLGQENWLDGRTVYVLRTSGVMTKVQPDSGEGFTIMVFDAETYRLLENRATLVQDGQEVLVSYERFWVDEVLPTGTPVVWDLSDLANVVFEDDLEGELANLILPTPVSLDDLLTLTPSVYVLHTVPDGFVMEISVSTPQDEPLYYMIAYHDAEGNHLVLQSAEGAEKMLEEIEEMEETYTTTSGLVLHLIREGSPPGSDTDYTMAYVQAPNAVSFLLSSNLPYEQVKTLAEDLILASASTP